jgi:DNA adenine methylase
LNSPAYVNPIPTAASILRWAGSKRKLLPELIPYWGHGQRRYIEPFAGSAALFFALKPKRALLSDINSELIKTLTVVRDNPTAVYKHVSRYPVGQESFYRLRALDPTVLSPVERAARFLFLNRFCFNGLYRTNENGHFNVPYSSQKTGGIPPWEQFSQAAMLLKRAVLKCGDFESVLLSAVGMGDFVYLDPPYAVGNRRIFRQYGSHTFGLQDLNRLNAVLREIQTRGAHFVLSYAYCREAKETFADWTSRRVYAQRNISGFARHRRRAAELIVTNINQRA